MTISIAYWHWQYMKSNIFLEHKCACYCRSSIGQSHYGFLKRTGFLAEKLSPQLSQYILIVFVGNLHFNFQRYLTINKRDNIRPI
jgi:hypothetical protein